MTVARTKHRIRDLAALLDALRALYAQLLEAIDAKMSALRRADVTGMAVCQERERAIAQRIEERLGFRRQLMERLGPELGVSSRDARAMSVSDVLSRVPPSDRDRLSGAASALRDLVFRVAQANRRLGAASLELLHHVQWVLSAVRPRDDGPSAYSPQGTRQSAGGACLMETVA